MRTQRHRVALDHVVAAHREPRAERSQRPLSDQHALRAQLRCLLASGENYCTYRGGPSCHLMFPPPGHCTDDGMSDRATTTPDAVWSRTIIHVAPDIGRTFDVHDRLGLARLHQVLQAAFGSQNSYLHRFATTPPLPTWLGFARIGCPPRSCATTTTSRTRSIPPCVGRSPRSTRRIQCP